MTKSDEKVVFVSGNFNILHPGHLRLLRFAKESGDRLLVGVISDRLSGEAAYVLEAHRLEAVKSCSLVDAAHVIDEPLENFILRLKPDIIVKGREHETAHNVESDIIRKYGGRLIFCSGETIFSSIDLIKRELKSSPSIRPNFPKDYTERHNIDKKRLFNIVKNFSELKICVVGDLIIDEYVSCQPLGMSHEEPVLVVTPVESTKYLGGAGIVAAHASSLGAQVSFLSVVGDDENRNFAINSLEKAGVDARMLVDSSRPTTLKRRYRNQGKSLFRVSILHQAGISREIQDELITVLGPAIDGADLLVFSDFNYGCLPNGMVEKIIEIAKNKGIILAADSQSSSQTGDICRFKGMDLITPTEREARISAHNHEDGLVVLAELLRQKSKAKNVLLKMGEEGLLIHTKEGVNKKTITDQIEALNQFPQDVAGAGDSLLITSAMVLASGGSIWEAACIGSIAASIQVGRVGNIPLNLFELQESLV